MNITDQDIRVSVQRTEPNNLQTYGSPPNTSAPTYTNKGNALNSSVVNSYWNESSTGDFAWRAPTTGQSSQLVYEYTGTAQSADYVLLGTSNVLSAGLTAGNRLDGTVLLKRARHTAGGLGASSSARVALEAFNGSTNLGTVAQGEGTVSTSTETKVTIASTRALPTGTNSFRVVVRWRGKAWPKESAVGLRQFFIREVVATSSTTNAPGWTVAGQASAVRIVPSAWAHGDNAYESTAGNGTSAAFAPMVTGITPNSWVGFGWTVNGDEGKQVRVRVEEFDSAGTKLRDATTSPFITYTGTPQRIEHRVQVGANTARVRTNLIWAAGTGVVQWAEVTTINAATVDGLSELGFMESFPYVNRVQNPNGDAGTFGWVDANNTVSITSVDEGMRVTATSTAKAQIAGTTLVPSDVYQTVSVRIKRRTAPYVRIGIRWAGAQGSFITNAPNSTTAHPAFGNDEEFLLVLPPVGKHINGPTASFGIELFNDAGMTTPAPVGSWVEFTDPTLYLSSTAEALSGYMPFVDGVRWVDVTGKTNYVNVVRKGVDVGTANFTLKGVDLDPIKTASLHPGKAVKVESLVNGLFSTVFTGVVDNASADYRTKTVRFNSVDNSGPLAMQRNFNGVANLADLSFMLSRATIPWEINGRTDVMVTSANTVYRDVKGTMKSHVLMTRDNVGGYVWVDRNGVLRVFDAANMPTQPLWVFRDVVNTNDVNAGGYYNNIDVTSNTEGLINSVTVTREVFDVGANKQGEAQDPVVYQDAASVRSFGEQNLDLTIMSRSNATGTPNAQTLADSILARHSKVRAMVKSIEVPVSETNMGWLTKVDLFDRCNVVYEGTTYQHRIEAVDHRIGPDGWTVYLEFRTLDGIAAKKS